MQGMTLSSQTELIDTKSQIGPTSHMIAGSYGAAGGILIIFWTHYYQRISKKATQSLDRARDGLTAPARPHSNDESVDNTFNRRTPQTQTSKLH